MDGDKASTKWIKRLGGLLAVLTPTALVLAAAVTMTNSGLESDLRVFLEWVRTQNAMGYVWFVMLDALLVVLLLPGVLLTLGAGLVFGVIPGTLLVVLGTTIGAVIAFLISRGLLKERGRAWLGRRGITHAIATALHDGGWRSLALLRAVPFFPFKLSNYALGAMDFSLRDFVIGTALGIVPVSFLNAYLGAMARDLVITVADEPHLPPLMWVSYGLGLLLAVICCWTIGRRARQILNADTRLTPALPALETERRAESFR